MGSNDLLTPREREEIARALRAGRDLSAPIAVTHFFSGRGHEPGEAAALLRERGLRVVVDEESSGDGYWHIAAFGELTLTPATIHQANRTMESIALQTRVHYDGWRVSMTIGEGG